MSVVKSEPVDYGAPEPLPRKNSKYAITSICIGVFCILWSITDTPIDPLKHDKIGAILPTVGITFAFGASREQNGKRLSTIVGLPLCLLAFVMNWFFPAWG
jgi:hypothetical protein